MRRKRRAGEEAEQKRIALSDDYLDVVDITDEKEKEEKERRKNLVPEKEQNSDENTEDYDDDFY